MVTMDARRHARFETGGTASVFTLGAAHWHGLGTVRNVSFGGVLIAFRERPEVAVGLGVQVRFGTVTATGEVRHITSQHGEFLVGVRVDNVQVTADAGTK